MLIIIIIIALHIFLGSRKKIICEIFHTISNYTCKKVFQIYADKIIINWKDVKQN